MNRRRIHVFLFRRRRRRRARLIQIVPNGETVKWFNRESEILHLTKLNVKTKSSEWSVNEKIERREMFFFFSIKLNNNWIRDKWTFLHTEHRFVSTQTRLKYRNIKRKRSRWNKTKIKWNLYTKWLYSSQQNIHSKHEHRTKIEYKRQRSRRRWKKNCRIKFLFAKNSKIGIYDSYLVFFFFNWNGNYI